LKLAMAVVVVIVAAETSIDGCASRGSPPYY
jgi:hypothetical protein